jgi:integrase
MPSSHRLALSRKPRRRPLMADPFKHPASGIYYLRRKVPAELKDALGFEFKRSLKTRDLTQAKAAFARAWAESEEIFALARATAAGGAPITIADAQQIAARWFRDEQSRMERDGRFDRMLASGPGWVVETPEGPVEGPTYLTLQEGAAEWDISPGEDWATLVDPHIRQTLRGLNQPMPSSGVSLARLRSTFAEHLHKLSAWALQRKEGQYVPPGQDVTSFQPLQIEAVRTRESRGPKLRAVFDSYADEKILNDGNNRATQRTIGAFKSTVERFIEVVGDLDVAVVDRAAVARFRAALAKMPSRGEGIRGCTASELISRAELERLPLLSEATIRNQLRALSAVLSHAVRMQWLSENPVIAGGVGRASARAATRKATSARRRKDYTREELRAIFTSPAITSSDWRLPRADFGRAWYWMPILLFYTGARREEIAQLRCTDLRQSEDGIWHLDILATNDSEDGDRGVKTEASRRLIPLHPDVLARGFLDYAASLPTTGQLFPLLSPNSAGYFGANFGKHWGNYLRDTVGLISPVSPMHGFRHTFKTLCRQVSISEEVHDAITGHAGNSAVAREYGSMPLSRIAKELSGFPRISEIIS